MGAKALIPMVTGISRVHPEGFSKFIGMRGKKFPTFRVRNHVGRALERAHARKWETISGASASDIDLGVAPLHWEALPCCCTFRMRTEGTDGERVSILRSLRTRVSKGRTGNRAAGDGNGLGKKGIVGKDVWAELR